MFQILKVESQSRINYLKNMRVSTIISLIFIGAVILFLGPALVVTLFTTLLWMDESLIAPVLVLVTLTLLIFLSLLSVNRIVKDLFMDRNMMLYMTFPVSLTQLFTAKILMHLATGILPFTLPAALFLGTALSVREGSFMPLAGSLFYMLLISFLILSISFIIVFFVTKVSKPARVSEVLTFAGGIISVLPYLIITMGAGNYAQVLSVMPDMTVWFEGYVYHANILDLLVNGVISLCISAVLMWLLVRMVGSGFIKGWSGENSRAVKVKSADSRVASPVKSLLSKDFTLTLRDFKEWAAILPQYLLPFIIYYAGIYQFGDTEHLEIGASLIALSITGTVIISLFISAMNTARDASHYEMIRVQPVRPKDLATAKYIYNVLTIIPVYLILSLGAFSFTDFSIVNLLLSWLCIILTALTMIPVGMYIGVTNPVVNKKKPTDRIGIGANIFIVIIMMVFFFSTGLLSTIYVDDTGSVITGGVMIFILILTITSMLSYIFILKKVMKVYDNGLIIEYKG